MGTEASHAIGSLGLGRDVGKAVQLAFEVSLHLAYVKERVPVTSASRSVPSGDVGMEVVRREKSSL